MKQNRTVSNRSRLGAIPALAALSMTPRSALAQSSTPVATPASETTTLPVELIGALTGPAEQSINATWEEYEVYGTDLGHTFLHGDEMYMIFGDTFGIGNSDWRSNVGAIITTDQDPGDGLTFDRMIADRPGHAKELLSPLEFEGPEVTIIPTYGVAVDGRIFLHYMQVVFWGPPGHWELGSSGFAYSDDAGENWTSDPNAVWPGDSNFGQVCIEAHDGHLYIFGIPGGRFGGVHLARVAPGELLELDAYAYWDGTGWVSDIESSATIVPAPVGELSVRWNSHYQTWIMMYLNEDRYAVVLRTADALMGPWSEESVVATGQEFPQLYAPYQLPKWNDRPDIFFTMSMFGPYQVYLMKTRLSR